MKYLLSLLMFAALAGCYKPATPQELKQQQYDEQQEKQRQMDEANDRIRLTVQFLHVCDTNGGVKSIWSGRYEQTITCNNGLQGRLQN
jgi:hypothetical protein